MKALTIFRSLWKLPDDMVQLDYKRAHVVGDEIIPYARFKAQSYNAEELWRDELQEGEVPAERVQNPPLRIPDGGISSNHRLALLGDRAGNPARIYDASGNKLLLPKDDAWVISQEEAVSQGYLEVDRRGQSGAQSRVGSGEASSGV